MLSAYVIPKIFQCVLRCFFFLPSYNLFIARICLLFVSLPVGRTSYSSGPAGASSHALLFEVMRLGLGEARPHNIEAEGWRLVCVE